LFEGPPSQQPFLGEELGLLLIPSKVAGVIFFFEKRGAPFLSPARLEKLLEADFSLVLRPLTPIP